MVAPGTEIFQLMFGTMNIKRSQFNVNMCLFYGFYLIL